MKLLTFPKRQKAEHLAGARTPRAASTALDPERRSEIISQYGKLLDRCPSSVGRETDLPFSKNVIRQAIYEELSENPNSDLRDHLEIAYIQLESFLPHEEYRLLVRFRFSCQLTQEIVKSGNPRDIVTSAKLLDGCEGDRAVKIQERISERMRKRSEEIRSVGWSSEAL